MPHLPFSKINKHLPRYPLHVHIGFLFSLLILISGATLGWYNHTQNSRLILDSADKLFDQVEVEMRMTVELNYAPIQNLTSIFAYQRITGATTLKERLLSLPYLHEELLTHKSIASIYVAYDDGSFFLLRPLRTEAMRKAFTAPADAAYMVQSVERTAGRPIRGLYLFFDASLTEISRTPRADYRYDPRDRDWYQRALREDRLVRTDPYIFFTTRELGLTFSRRSGNVHSVVGVDATMENTSRLLLSRKITPSTRMVWFDRNEQVIAFDQPEHLMQRVVNNGQGKLRLPKVGEMGVPILELVMAEYRRHQSDFSSIIKDGRRDWKVEVIQFPQTGKVERVMAIAAPMDELLAEAVAIRNNATLITILIVLLMIPITWMVSRMISRPLRHLAKDARQIRAFRFSETGKDVKSFIWEIHHLAQAVYLMRSAIRKFLDISSTLASERHFDRLFERVLNETSSAATADGGFIYLLEDDEITLTPVIQYFLTTSAVATDLPVLRLDQADQDNPLIASARAGQTRVIRITRGQSGVDWLDPLLARLGHDAATLVSVPLRNRQSELIGLLCLLKSATAASTGNDDVKPELVSFIEALSGVSAIAIDNQRLLKAQRDLLESLIRLMANAIDAKSPYTGGHCQRVPELTRMLAQAACDSKEGAMKDFELSDDEWEELHIASWLHDCGKVTTPEYVVDKATKLETIHDRLHEIRMRFEVLKRDAEIDYWKRLANGEEVAALRPELERQWRVLDEEFAFVARCNEGGEFMAPEKIVQMEQIAARTWLRTLDDRIGLSQEEQARKSSAAAPLPVRELLLADKVEHIIPRQTNDQICPDNRWGFKLNVPQYIQNRGEIYNLSIGRGTLTGEERYIINDHIVQTIIMLSQLPFPKHLKHVPEIAGGHHETMDGRGYPRRLRRDEMSTTARIMAIADIFEALTAVDRPYKHGKTLSEALRIMGSMKNDGHVDPVLFELFLRSGVYLRYAERFLQPEQIDAVNVDEYLR
ncbi:MAG: HD domain-containing phosphohydrolase [Syntrophus sp. (in: bacteria)]